MPLGPRMLYDAQCDGIIANDDWACPACSHLTPTQKKERSNFSEQELIKITWAPTWEPGLFTGATRCCPPITDDHNGRWRGNLSQSNLCSMSEILFACAFGKSKKNYCHA